jgi:hypothetical protein
MGNLSDLDWEDIDENKASAGVPLPIGQYLVSIIDSETRDNSNGTGDYLSITYEVIEGEHQGRKIFENLTLNHTNQQAVDIGRAKLKRLVKTVGFNGISDSSELHGQNLTVKVGQRKRKDTGDLANEIKAYLPAVGAEPAPQKQEPKPAAKTNGAPWKK